MSNTVQPESRQTIFERYGPLVLIGFVTAAAVADGIARRSLWLGVALYACANLALAVLLINAIRNDRHKPVWGTRSYVIVSCVLVAMFIGIVVLGWHEILTP